MSIEIIEIIRDIVWVMKYLKAKPKAKFCLSNNLKANKKIDLLQEKVEKTEEENKELTKLLFKLRKISDEKDNGISDMKLYDELKEIQPLIVKHLDSSTIVKTNQLILNLKILILKNK